MYKLHQIGLFTIYLCSSLMMQAEAGVTIQGTRIVFPSNAKSVSVQLDNSFDTPALLQSWVDVGDINQMPDATKIPFVLTPALTRIEPHSGQIIRIIPTGQPTLPQDRESIFWFNLLDIPPERASDANKNLLSFNVRTRIKLFYRPIGLKMAQDVAFKSIKFSYQATTHILTINNPSPYYMNFEKFVFNPTKNPIEIAQPTLVAPFSSTSIDKIHVNAHVENLEYTLINDMGGKFNTNFKF